MDVWTFVIAAYVVAASGTAGLFAASYRAMRNAECAADKIGRREPAGE